jgi:hypothetical protein
MDIDKLEAGREIDVLVAEKVEGWIWVRCVAHHDKKIYRWLRSPNDWLAGNGDAVGNEPLFYGWDDIVPYYSTRLDVALDTIRGLTNIAHFVITEYVFNDERECWGECVITCFVGCGFLVYDAVAATLPLAICRALLKVVEDERSSKTK